MSDTIRELILQDIICLAGLGFGYNSVYRGRTQFEYQDLPCVTILPGKETAERIYGKQQIIMPVSIYAIQIIDNNELGALAETILGRLINNIVGYRSTFSTWEASTTYSSGSYVVPTTWNDYYYEVTNGGDGDSGESEPSWPTTAGNTVSDGDLIWTCREMVYSNIDDIHYNGGGVETWPEQEEQALSVQIDIEIRYKTKIGDPYSQT